jgi:hypothetical protein
MPRSAINCKFASVCVSVMGDEDIVMKCRRMGTGARWDQAAARANRAEVRIIDGTL